MKGKEIDELKLMGVKSLKKFGFVNVTVDNIMADEVYSFFFGRFLASKKGTGTVSDDQIDVLLAVISKKNASQSNRY